MLWAPDSTAFFINDGNGSGQSSEFHIVDIGDHSLLDDTSAGLQAQQVYRLHYPCREGDLPPNVWGLEWSSDSKRIFVLVQPRVHSVCQTTDQFMVLEIDATSHDVAEAWSSEQARDASSFVLPDFLGE